MNNENTETKRTSKYSGNRRNYLDRDGSYIYWAWSEEHKKEIPIRLTPGENGITKDWVIFLDGIDHDEDLGDRYEAEHRSDQYENCEAVKRDSEGELHRQDAAELAAPYSDPQEILYGDPIPENPDIEKVRSVIEELTPAQIDLIFTIYGDVKQAVDIAREDGVSKAAITNRMAKIQKRVAKLYAEAGE